MPNHAITFVDPWQLRQEGEQQAFPVGIDRRCLAQGDSWFSIGALPPGLTSNILAELVLSPSMAVVNCARPGKELRLMVDTMQDSNFMRFLAGGNLAVEFDAIFVSGGGNDMIAAASMPPSADPVQRIFLTPVQRGGMQVPVTQYLSPNGWKAFSDHITHWFGSLVSSRDSGVNKNKPLFFHNYEYCRPRPAGAGLGFGPWLDTAMGTYSIPEGDRLALTNELMDRLSRLLSDIVAANIARDPNCNIFLIDTRTGAHLDLAAEGSTGESGDWINEIHPSYQGYRKIASVWRQQVDPHI
jgi:hypothetical protein